MPSPTTFPDDPFGDPCGARDGLGGYDGDHHPGFLHWTRDGARLVFDVDDTVWMLDVEDARVLRVADADKNYGDGNLNLVDKFWYGFHADVSPDGSRIVLLHVRVRGQGTGWPGLRDRSRQRRRLRSEAIDDKQEF